MISSKLWAFMTVTLVAAMIVAVAEAQPPAQDCASKLIGCADYLNSTKPPPSCCDPLKEAVAHQLQCLCNLYTTPGLLKGFGVNVTEALLLPKNCNITGDLSACKGLSGSSPPSSSSPAPPSPPASTAAPAKNNGVQRKLGHGGAVLALASMMMMMFI